MLFTRLPPGSRIPGRFPGPAHARGKWFTVDIHCHIRSTKATEMVEGNEAVSRWYLETQASPSSRQINQQNAVRTNLQSVSAEQRIADMDHMGIDIQAISPAPRQTYYGADPDPDLGLAVSRQINDDIAETCGRFPDRFVGLGTVPFQRSGALAGSRDQPGSAVSRSRRNRRICRNRASGRSSRAARSWDYWCSCIPTALPRPAGFMTIISPMSSATRSTRRWRCIT
jgi:hypothetical protein